MASVCGGLWSVFGIFQLSAVSYQPSAVSQKGESRKWRGAGEEEGGIEPQRAQRAQREGINVGGSVGQETIRAERREWGYAVWKEH